MLGQSERVIVDLLAQAADVVPDLVLDLGQLLLCLLRHLNHIELRVDVTCGRDRVTYCIMSSYLSVTQYSIDRFLAMSD